MDAPGCRTRARNPAASQEAAKASDAAFSMLGEEEIRAHLEPSRYIGRCPEQVEAFLEGEVRPVLARYPDALRKQEAELKV